MILRKHQFVGPIQPLHFGSDYVNFLETTTCLGVTIDDKLSWRAHVDLVRSSFSKKMDALRRMSYLPELVLDEIYFKTIIPSVTYTISMWRNCSQSLLHSLDHIHARACRIINHLPSKLDDSICLSKCNWLTFDYLYKKRILLKMYQVWTESAPRPIQ